MILNDLRVSCCLISTFQQAVNAEWICGGLERPFGSQAQSLCVSTGKVVTMGKEM